MKIKLVIIIVLFIITSLLFVFKFPIKKAEKMQIINGDKYKITYKETKILCQISSFPGPMWEIVGKNNIYYPPKERPGDQVILAGNYPKKVGSDIFNTPIFNTFIYYGYFEKDTSHGYKVFYVKKWNMLYPIVRYFPFNFVPDNALTPYDYLLSSKVSNEP